MNTILLQKILDILREGLAHVGDFFKDLFISDPQDGQIIAYDSESGHWVNKDATEVELDLTNTFDAQAVATITDGAENVPMKSLIVDIVPKQASGTPTPDNPLPISGWDSIPVKHTGVNLWDEQTELGNIDNDGQDIPSNNILRSKGYISIKPNIELYFKCSTSSGHNLTVFYYDVNKSFISLTYRQNQTGTTPANAYYMRFKIGSSYGTTYNHDVSINYPATITTYEPYTATTHTITLPSTVYGGEVDLISGQGTITKGYIASYNGESINEPWISSMDVYTPGGTPTTGAQVIYPLTTPTPITTTPTTIKTQGGTESIYSDTGDVSGEYYTKTSESVLDLVNITEDITSQVTVNNTDWSSLQYKVVKNNNVITIYLYSATTTEHGSVELFSGLPRAAYNGPVLLFDTDNNAVVNAKVDTSGYLDVTMAAGGTVKGTITYVAK